MLLTWLPDETLYSLCSREHYATGNIFHTDTCKSLFGHQHIGSSTDFPARLSHLIDFSEGKIGAAPEIINGHSILPYFLHWRTEDFKEKILKAVLAANTRGVISTKYILGITSSSFPTRSALRACEACIKLDEERYGIPYWHLSHQYPGVWCCETHSLILKELVTTLPAVRKDIWQLPHPSKIKSIEIYKKNKDALDTPTDISKFSAICQNFGRLSPHTSIDLTVLHKTYQQQLETLGLRHHGRNLLSEVAPLYCDALRALTSIPELSTLPVSYLEAKSQIATLFKSTSSTAHPIRHLSFIYFLYRSWEHFWDSYENNLTTRAHPKIQTSKKIATNIVKFHNLEKEISTLTQKGKLTSRETAKRLGVHIDTILIYAERGGTPFPRRPKKLKPVIREKILSELRSGTEVKELSERYDISRRTLRNLLRANPDTLSAHKINMLKQSKLLYRQRWGDILLENPENSIMSLRMLSTQAYTWLHTHDNEWLAITNKLHKTHSKHNNKKSQWLVRDTTLITLIFPEIETLRVHGELSLANLIDRVPRLRNAIRHLPKLPKTCQALLKNKILPSHLNCCSI